MTESIALDINDSVEQTCLDRHNLQQAFNTDFCVDLRQSLATYPIVEKISARRVGGINGTQFTNQIGILMSHSSLRTCSTNVLDHVIYLTVRRDGMLS